MLLEDLAWVFFLWEGSMAIFNLSSTSINPKGQEPWVYQNFKVGNLLKLAWKDDESNANKPQREDLILLLRQNGYTTHLIILPIFRTG